MKEEEKKMPKCDRRRVVNGEYMCYAIGCCEIGDMLCECPVCNREGCPKKEDK